MEEDKTKQQLEQKEKDLQEQISDLEKADPKHDHFRTVENVVEEDSEEAERGNLIIGIKTALREQLKQVRNALLKLRHGSYTLCDRCGKPIEKERLKAVPEATYCLHCEKKMDRLRA